MTDDIRKKTQAVFLAVIMALSMVAMTAAFSGAAAAQNAPVDEGESSVDDVVVTDNQSDTTSTLNTLLGNSQSVTDNGAAVNLDHKSVLSTNITNDVNSFQQLPNLGPVLGVPAQTDFYQTALNADPPELANDDGTLNTPVANSQFSHVAVAVSGNQSDGLNELVLDYTDSVDAGVEVNASGSALVAAPEDVAPGDADSGGFDLGVTPAPGQPQAGTSLADNDNVTVNNQVGEIRIEYNNTADFEGQAFVFQLSLEASDPVEGVSVGSPLSDDQASLNYEANLESRDDNEVDTSSESDSYRLIESGAVGIAQNDAVTGLVGQEDYQTSFDGDASGAAFFTWLGSTITFQTNTNGETIQIYEAVENDSDNLIRGDRVARIGTAPAEEVNFDTSQLSDSVTGTGDFFITFGDNSDDQVYLEVDELNFDASYAEQTVFTDEEIEVDISSDDITGGEVQTWLAEADEDGFQIDDVIHVEDGQTDGTGSETLTVDPQDDLNGEGQYVGVAAHIPSGTVVPLGAVDADNGVTVEPEPESSVEIVEPVPPREDPYVRGDIIRVELDYDQTDVATLTFGDRTGDAPGEGGNQNFEMNVTVRDTNGDGTGVVYINTFQIGDNRTAAEPQGGASTFYPEPTNVTDDGNEVGFDFYNDEVEGINHGVQAGPGTELQAPGNYDAGGDGNTVDVYQPEHDIRGGSAGGAVIAGGVSYSLVATSTDLPHKVEGSNPTDRSAVRIENRDKDLDLDLWNAPGSGSSEVSPETVEEINNAINATPPVISPADGNVADNDFLIFQAQAEGLEGVIYDDLLKSDDNDLADTSMRQLIDPEVRGDDVITDEFFASELINVSATEVADITEAGNNEPRDSDDQVTISLADFEDPQVIVDQNEAGFRQYFIPLKFESGTEVSTATGTTELETNTEFSGNFTLDAPAVDQDEIPANLQFADEEGELVSVNFDFVDDQTNVTTGEELDQLVVPNEENVTVTGTTNIASGTELLFTVESAAEVEQPIFERFRTTVEYEEAAPNSWSFNAGDAFAAEALDNTEFDVRGQRARDAQELMPDGEPFPGVISPTEVVDTHVFNDQQVGNTSPQTVIVQEIQFNRSSGRIAIESDGEIIGTSGRLEGGVLHENVPVVLDQTLEDDAELTSVAYRNIDTERQFTEGPVSQTATIEVGEDQPANFDVSGLDPTTATVNEPGADPANLTVSATVTNTGEMEATQDIRFEVGGNVIDTEESVTLAGGASEDVSFTVDTSGLSDLEPGDYTHAIASDDDSAEGTLTIAAPATFEITDYGPSSATVSPGDTVEASVTIQNTGDVEGTQTISFNAGDGLVTQEVDVTLGPGEETTETISFTAPDVDETTTVTHTLTTDNDEASGELTIEVEPPEDDEPQDDGDGNDTDGDGDGDDSGPGFGIAAALVALLGAALLAYRRRAE